MPSRHACSKSAILLNTRSLLFPSTLPSFLSCAAHGRPRTPAAHSFTGYKTRGSASTKGVCLPDCHGAAEFSMQRASSVSESASSCGIVFLISVIAMATRGRHGDSCAACSTVRITLPTNSRSMGRVNPPPSRNHHPESLWRHAVGMDARARLARQGVSH